MERNRDPRSQAHLGKAIRASRERAGLTQAVLGSRVDLSPSWLSHVEAGHVNITWGNLRRIAGGVSIGLDSLLRLVGDYEQAEAVGTAVRRIRQEQGLTQVIVAQRAGLTRHRLAQIEMGKDPHVSQEMQGRLQGALGVRKGGWNSAVEAAKGELGVT